MPRLGPFRLKPGAEPLRLSDALYFDGHGINRLLQVIQAIVRGQFGRHTPPLSARRQSPERIGAEQRQQDMSASMQSLSACDRIPRAGKIDDGEECGYYPLERGASNHEGLQTGLGSLRGRGDRVSAASGRPGGLAREKVARDRSGAVGVRPCAHTFGGGPNESQASVETWISDGQPNRIGTVLHPTPRLTSKVRPPSS